MNYRAKPFEYILINWEKNGWKTKIKTHGNSLSLNIYSILLYSRFYYQTQASVHQLL